VNIYLRAVSGIAMRIGTTPRESKRCLICSRDRSRRQDALQPGVALCSKWRFQGTHGDGYPLRKMRATKRSVRPQTTWFRGAAELQANFIHAMTAGLNDRKAGLKVSFSDWT